MKNPIELPPGWRLIDSLFGPLLLGFSEAGLAALALTEFVATQTALDDLIGSSSGRVVWADNPDAFEATQTWLAAYESGVPPGSMPPLDLAGTDFQRRAWAELIRIPAGQTRTYQEIARAIGRPAASRAVGSAVGANPVSIIIPCHRVLRGDGALGGYRWSPRMKTRLLAHENRFTAATAITTSEAWSPRRHSSFPKLMPQG